MAKTSKPQQRGPDDAQAALIGGGVLALLVGLLAWLKRATIKTDLQQQVEQRERAAALAKPRHQMDNVNISGVVLTGSALVVAIVASLLAAGALFSFFVSHPLQLAAPPLSSLAETAQVPPEPRSQPDLRPDLQHLRATEDATLHSYGWIDRPNNVVRIPIDRAIDLIVQQGMPTTAPQPNATPASK